MPFSLTDTLEFGNDIKFLYPYSSQSIRYIEAESSDLTPVVNEIGSLANKHQCISICPHIQRSCFSQIKTSSNSHSEVFNVTLSYCTLFKYNFCSIPYRRLSTQSSPNFGRILILEQAYQLPVFIV